MLYEIKHNRHQYSHGIMIFADLNNLKYINDHYGHETGNLMLSAAAECILNAYGGDGDCYRIGGDEFCIILLNPSTTWDSISDRLRMEVAAYNESHSLPYPLSIAYGASDLTPTLDVDIWKEKADLAMYRDKKRYHSGKELFIP